MIENLNPASDDECVLVAFLWIGHSRIDGVEGMLKFTIKVL